MMNYEYVISIAGRRDCYGINQLERTMTVGELIEYLERFDYDAPVCINNDNGYTYGIIKESSFREEYSEEDEWQ